jgi:hypothetical protein
MFSFTRLCVLLTVFTVSFANALAHGQSVWNRRISDVRIVHPPGTPPGTWRVVSTLDFGAENSSPAALDLSLEMTVELNGIPIHSQPISAFMMPRGCQFGGSCTTNNCIGGILDGFQLGGVCGIRNFMCACWSTLEVTIFQSNYFSTDLIGVVLTPSPGSLPETDTSDDTFSFHIEDQLPGSTFCAGDGALADHTTPCPCGNNGAAEHGCAHSFNAAGGRLVASGVVATDTVELGATELPATSFTLFIQHANAGDAVFHDGVLCAGNPLVRLRGRSAVGGDAWFPNSNFAQDSTTTLSTRGGVTVGSGATRYYAAWFRNASTTFCPPATANVTNGWQIVW